MKKIKVVLKAKRHEFYKQALVLYRETYAKLHLGLCCTLTDVTDTNCYNEGMQRFPEIYKHGNEELAYWWSNLDTKIRIEVLKEAIELTKPKVQL